MARSRYHHGTPAHIARVINTRGSFVRKVSREEATFSEDHRAIMAADLIKHVSPAIFKDMTDLQILQQYSWLLKLRLVKKIPVNNRRKNTFEEDRINKVLGNQQRRD